MNWTRLTELETFSLGFNLLSGALPKLPTRLQQLDLSHNRLTGSLELLVESFCDSETIGKNLREIHLNHNDLTGRLPTCLMRFSKLKRLSLNNNRLVGGIPPVEATELVTLTLHHNELSGELPSSLQNLDHLAVFTVHENFLDGSVGALKLTAPCIDNNKLNFRGFGCGVLRMIRKTSNFTCRGWEGVGKKGKHLTKSERLLVEQNCPELCNSCDLLADLDLRSSKATFHHNRFSCALPPSLSVNSSIYATVVMGNMVGNGQRLNVSWISADESYSFLYL